MAIALTAGKRRKSLQEHYLFSRFFASSIIIAKFPVNYIKLTHQTEE